MITLYQLTIKRLLVNLPPYISDNCDINHASRILITTFIAYTVDWALFGEIYYTGKIDRYATAFDKYATTGAGFFHIVCEFETKQLALYSQFELILSAFTESVLSSCVPLYLFNTFHIMIH